MRFGRRLLISALGAAAVLSGVRAHAEPMVTYSWTTTSVGFGLNAFQPSSATFEAPLHDVLKGVIPQSDITDIQLLYPGLSFDSAATSSIGFDFSAFVDPGTGSFIYKDTTQGLAVVAFAGTDINSMTTYLSITVDNPVANSVADTFNALNNGNADAGWPTAGYWSASFPPVPEPATWASLLTGFGGLGVIAHRRRARQAS